MGDGVSVAGRPRLNVRLMVSRDFLFVGAIAICVLQGRLSTNLVDRMGRLKQFPLRDWREASAMFDTRAVFGEGGHVNCGAVSFMRREFVLRKAGVNFEHVSVTRCLRQN